jgi:YHS domain-containing protein
MKQTTQSLLLAACVLGVAAFSLQAADTNAAAAGCGMGCCSGMSATVVADAINTNGVPDLLKTCPVSGDKLGEMGAAYVFSYKGQEIKLCCKGCKKDFDKNPDKYIKLIRAADKATAKAADKK